MTNFECFHKIVQNTLRPFTLVLMILVGLTCFIVEPAQAQPALGNRERLRPNGERKGQARVQAKNQQPSDRRLDPASGLLPGSANRPEKHGALNFFKDLDLSEDQRQKLQTMMQDGRQQSQALREKSKGRYRAMMDYMATPNATEAKALDMQREIQADQAKMSELRIQSWFKMRSILTPEQLEQVQTKFKEHQSKIEAFHDRRQNWQQNQNGFGARRNGLRREGGDHPERFGEHPPRPSGLMPPPGPPPEEGPEGTLP